MENFLRNCEIFDEILINCGTNIKTLALFLEKILKNVGKHKEDLDQKLIDYSIDCS